MLSYPILSYCMRVIDHTDNVSAKSKLQHPPPPPLGIPQAFGTFAVPGRREFDYQSLPGGGEFDCHALGVGNLNCTLDFVLNPWRGELSWGTRC